MINNGVCHNLYSRKYRDDHIKVEDMSGKGSRQYIYTGCNRRNGPDFGRMFLMLNYTDITQNTYIQS